MDFYHVPIGFGLALSANTAAMNRYAHLSENEKQNYILAVVRYNRPQRKAPNKKTEVYTMNTSDYNKYLSAIKAANDSADKEALRQIQKQLIAKYSLDDRDAEYLIRQFRYTV